MYKGFIFGWGILPVYLFDILIFFNHIYIRLPMGGRERRDLIVLKLDRRKGFYFLLLHPALIP